MGKEQLKQLNERLAKAEKLLEEADKRIKLHANTLEYELKWREDYDSYLKTYKQ